MSVRTDPWPVYYRDILRVKDPDHYVGIVTLWTERDVVKRYLDEAEAEYNVVGNLYSAAGINHVMRNIFANPAIRYLVLWGADMSLSGTSLLRLKKAGVDGDYKITGDSGEIERAIPKAAIDEFRRKVEVVDLRGKPASEMVKVVKGLPKKEPFAKKPRLFPPEKVTVTTWPSEQTGFRVEAKTVAQTWLRLLNVIHKYGRIKKTRYSSSNELKEVFNMVAVISSEDPDDIYFPDYLPFTKKDLQVYYPEILTARRIKGTAYNYGARMRNYRDKINQVEEVKKLLKRRPDSKKMLIILPDPADDWARADKGDTPCLTQVVGGVQDSKFWMTAHFRSHDMVHAWALNAFALRKLQKEIADAGGYPMGKLAIISHSAHIYADDFKWVEDVLKKWYKKELKHPKAHRFEPDQRGNWLIKIEKDEKGRQIIKAQLFTSNMKTMLWEAEGTRAMDIYYEIADWDLVGLTSQAAYLGEELAKAEMAIKLGIDYEQDKPLKTSNN
ncbi:MAG: hypothetical protein GXP43_00365 [bacterium]|nr:hypothetical protein [bacterium]